MRISGNSYRHGEPDSGPGEERFPGLGLLRLAEEGPLLYDITQPSLALPSLLAGCSNYTTRTTFGKYLHKEPSIMNFHVTEARSPPKHVSVRRQSDILSQAWAECNLLSLGWYILQSLLGSDLKLMYTLSR